MSTAFMFVSAHYHSIFRLFSSRSNVLQAHLYRYSAARCAVVSTRICYPPSSRHACGLKQQNTATEHLLERWVEPLTAWAWKLGAPYPKGFVRLAWKYLLQNHPHDSICGCSIDQVHRENSVRFAQSQQIGENLVTQAMHHLASVTDTRARSMRTATAPQRSRSHSNRCLQPGARTTYRSSANSHTTARFIKPGRDCR